MSVLKIKNSQGEFEPVLTIDPSQEVADWIHGNAADTIDGWLDDNIMQETGYVLDRSLTSTNAAAPADMVGDVKSAFTSELTLMSIYKGSDYSTPGTWDSDGTGWTLFLKVRPGARYLITAQADRKVLMGGLKSLGTIPPADNTAFIYSDETGWTSRKEISSGNSISGALPSDVNYLEIYSGPNSDKTKSLPAVLNIDGVDYRKTVLSLSNDSMLNSLGNSTELSDGDDLFDLGVGSYFKAGSTSVLNSPTTNAFRLFIFNRSDINTMCAILVTTGGRHIYTNGTVSGSWLDWEEVATHSGIYGADGSVELEDGDDLFSLGVGSYYKGSATTVDNAPTNKSFRLFIYQRTAAAGQIAVLITTAAREIWVNGTTSGEWKNWVSLTKSVNVPAYYDDYLDEKLKAIKELENSISYNSDSFIFLTDYHYPRNTKNSPELIKEIVKETGITKMIFGGDAYATVTSNESRTATEARNFSQKYVPRVYSAFQSAARECFGVTGNHEWNHYQDSSLENLAAQYEQSLSGVYNNCIKRYESYVSDMSYEGNYYVDNTAKGIRYFFLSENGDARPTPDTMQWLGTQLERVPSGYYVMVIAHYVYIPVSGGVEPGLTSYAARARYFPKLINDMLQAYNTKSTFSMDASYTANGTTVTYSGNYDFTNADGGNVICLLSGHVHQDREYLKSSSNVLAISTMGDLYKDGDGNVLTYSDGQGTTYERTPETVREQAFDVVHIDLTNRKLYTTRIGGGFDREYSW